MEEFQREEMARKEGNFFKCYGSLKTSVKKVRETIKGEVKEEVIKGLMENLETEEPETMQIFNEILSCQALSQELREKMERASTMVRDALIALKEVPGSLKGPLDLNDRKEIAQQLLRND